MRRLMLTIVFLGLPACAHRGPAPSAFDHMTDQEKLLLFQRLPIGTPSEHVQAVIPGLEYSPRHRRWERDIVLLGRPAVVQVAVEDGQVRLWNYRIPWLDAAAGDSLFTATLEFYTSRFGEPHAEDAADVDYFDEYRGWCRDDMKLALHALVQAGGTQDIVIGVQEPCPHWPPASESKPPFAPGYGG